MSHAAARLAFLALSASLALQAEPGVVLYLDGTLPESVAEQEMKAEFAGLTEPLGLSTQWRSLAGRNNVGEVGRLIVVKLLGDCSTTAKVTAIADGQVMASVQEVDGRILPFIDVRCDALVSLIRPSLRYKSAYEQRALLGRALGRVVAHEVYHVIGQTHHHADDGIARARLTGTDLTSHNGYLSNESATVMAAPARTFASSDAAGSDGR